MRFLSQAMHYSDSFLLTDLKGNRALAPLGWEGALVVPGLIK